MPAEKKKKEFRLVNFIISFILSRWPFFAYVFILTLFNEEQHYSVSLYLPDTIDSGNPEVLSKKVYWLQFFEAPIFSRLKTIMKIKLQC